MICGSNKIETTSTQQPMTVKISYISVPNQKLVSRSSLNLCKKCIFPLDQIIRYSSTEKYMTSHIYSADRVIHRKLGENWTQHLSNTKFLGSYLELRIILDLIFFRQKNFQNQKIRQNIC